jgi:hypothetical protein
VEVEEEELESVLGIHLLQKTELGWLHQMVDTAKRERTTIEQEKIRRSDNLRALLSSTWAEQFRQVALGPWRHFSAQKQRKRIRNRFLKTFEQREMRRTNRSFFCVKRHLKMTICQARGKQEEKKKREKTGQGTYTVHATSFGTVCASVIYQQNENDLNANERRRWERTNLEVILKSPSFGSVLESFVSLEFVVVVVFFVLFRYSIWPSLTKHIEKIREDSKICEEQRMAQTGNRVGPVSWLTSLRHIELCCDLWRGDCLSCQHHSLSAITTSG